MTGVLPGANDVVLFGYYAQYPTAASTNCVGLTGSFSDVQITDTYHGTVALGGATTIGALLLAGGAISQPTSGTDLTVTSSFTWTGGTLNSSANLASVTITGSSTTALVAPIGGGAVTLGSDLNFVNGAAVTLKEGTIDPNKAGVEVSTTTGASLHFAPDTIAPVVLGVTQYLNGRIGPGTNWTVESDLLVRIHGDLANNGGTYTVLAGARVEISGNDLSDVAYSQVGNAAGTYLHGDSELVTPSDRVVLVEAGILATVYASDVASANATITTKRLEINGGDIYVDYLGSNYHFGELLVDGNVLWSGGTFHVYVYSGGTANDVWRTTNASGYGGRFDVDGGTIAPIYLDSDYGTSSLPLSNSSWEILKAGGGLVDNDAPSVSDAVLWQLQISISNPSTYWKLVAN